MFKKNKSLITNLHKILLLFLLLALLWRTFLVDSTFADIQETRISVNSSLVPHSPFIITSDLDFETYGFPGDGSETTPYIIENYEIITSADKGISISHTTKYFIVRNCYVDAIDTGIHIISVAKNTTLVANNTCTYSEYGIRCESSEKSIIKNNTCLNNDAYGIYTWNGSNLIISDNNCTNNNMRGIYLQDCILSTVSNNTCNSNTQWGIYFVHSHNNTIHNNTCSFNEDKGIYFWGSDSCNITHNLLEKNEGYGVYLDYNSEHNIVFNNTFNNDVVVSSQAFDDDVTNQWFDSETNTGNFWSDWSGTGPYAIEGAAGSLDLYPLSEPIIPIPELDMRQFFLMLLVIPFIFLVDRSPKRKKQ